MKEIKKLIIVDLFGIIFKAYYSFFHTSLKTSTGESSSTIYGFFRIFMSAIRKFSPDYLIIASDSKGPTFRHEMYNEYKANRVDKPEDLKVQISMIIKILNTFQFNLISQDGFEADDIIGTICKKYKTYENLKILILTQDKDIHQLIDKNVHIISSIKGFSEFIIYDQKESFKKWGVETSQIINYLSLIGDTSDNIPGAKGIGPKSALYILEKFKSLDEIYTNLNYFKPAIKKKLLDSKKNIYLSQELIKIKTNIPLEINLENCQTPSMHLSKEGIEYFQHYEFTSLIKDIQNNFTNETPKKLLSYKDVQSTYNLIYNKETFLNLIQNLEKNLYLSIDIETESLDILSTDIIGMSFCYDKSNAYFLPIPSKKNTLPSKWLENEKMKSWDLTRNFIISKIQTILENKNIMKIGQNIKFDYMIIKNQLNIEIKNIHFDTMIASFLLHPNSRYHNLGYLAEKFLSYKTLYYTDLISKKENENLTNISIDIVTIYAAEDAAICFQLYQKFYPLINYSFMKNFFFSFEMPLLKVLGNMQLHGVYVDKKYWISLVKKIDEKIDSIQKKIFSMVGEKFNIHSYKQLSNILFNKLKLPVQKKNKSGYSTDNEALLPIKKHSKVIPLILRYRTLFKMKTTYLNIEYIHPKTNRIHTNYNQIKTRTGRLSSSHPNLQNIPNEHHKLSQILRKGFIVKKGFVLLCADYSQIELRILAHFTNDKNLIQAYRNNEDIHTKTASLIFNKSQKNITSKERYIAKTLNFSIIYGAGIRNISKQIHVSQIEAKNLIKKYFDTYPNVKKYIEDQKNNLKQTYTKTLFGRIRYIDPSLPQHQRLRFMINTPIQGTSADIIKIAMVNIQKKLDENNLKSSIVMQIHDELIFEIPLQEYTLVKSLIKDKMENAFTLKVPLKISSYTCTKYWYKKISS